MNIHTMYIYWTLKYNFPVNTAIANINKIAARYIIYIMSDHMILK